MILPVFFLPDGFFRSWETNCQIAYCAELGILPCALTVETGTRKFESNIFMSKPQRQTLHHLKENCLSYAEVIAQSISVIAPSTVPAAVLGLIFASAGNGTWLSFFIAIIGLLFVCFNINQFARRSASPGSLYTYIVKGLG